MKHLRHVQLTNRPQSEIPGDDSLDIIYVRRRVVVGHIVKI